MSVDRWISDEASCWAPSSPRRYAVWTSRAWYMWPWSVAPRSMAGTFRGKGWKRIRYLHIWIYIYIHTLHIYYTSYIIYHISYIIYYILYIIYYILLYYIYMLWVSQVMDPQSSPWVEKDEVMVFGVPPWLGKPPCLMTQTYLSSLELM